jgi:hypothetical protein
MSQVKIVPSVLRAEIEEGMKLIPLAEKYNLPIVQMKAVLKQLGLQIRRFHLPKFIIVDEEAELEPTPLEVLIEEAKTIEVITPLPDLTDMNAIAAATAVVVPVTEPTLVAFEAEKAEEVIDEPIELASTEDLFDFSEETPSFMSDELDMPAEEVAQEDAEIEFEL